ncbi:MAG: F0F1 ATP synthase subunit A [Candidatus Cloacimonetes bacterium]|jgi:F-type H+-transporting ATPase subunit a|nr:F0F1 ATP synthase subunit A [Candidatus Cloacimonadota bacterium]MDY0171425.1 F0F1 ATP synthase subunit A [Candidatus Cloacimonadaceae bacterium]
MRLSPDELIYWQHGWFKINATIGFTWVIMLILVLGSYLLTRNLGAGKKVSKKQSFLEIIVIGMKNQIAELGLDNPTLFIGFLGTLFLFIASSVVLELIPGFEPPTASLSTTTALALSVFLAVPVFGIMETGIKEYISSYLKPTVIMLPFNIISEITRTIALAVRLFGNIMSGGMIVGILISISPFIFPIVMRILGLLTGMVQAYIFSILAGVYIAAATHTDSPKQAEVEQATASNE